MFDFDPFFKLIIDCIFLVLFLLLTIFYFKNNISAEEVRVYAAPKYFTIVTIFTVSIWLFLYYNFQELYNKFVTNYAILAMLFLVTGAVILSIIVYINKNIMHKIRSHITLKKLSSAILIIILFGLSAYSMINNAIKGTDNLQIVLLIIASLSLFLVILDVDYSKNFKEIKDLILDSKIYVPFAQKVGDSEFEFNKMVGAATTSVFIIGPNLAFISKNKEVMKRFLFDKFQANNKFEIRMLLMDPENKDNLNINHLGFTKDFWKELRDSVEVFANWKSDAEERKFKFDVRVTNVLTLSLLFRDKSTSEGCVLVTPIPNGSEGANRSCFLLKKKVYEMAFYEYYDAYNKIFDSEEYSKDIFSVWTCIGKFTKMVSVATRSIFIVGPNLAFLSNNEKDMKKLLFDKLQANNKFEIRMLLMDPKIKDNLNINHLGFAEQFWSELEKSVEIFTNWKDEAEERNLNFDIRVTNILSDTLLFRDEYTPEGCVLITSIRNGSNGANMSRCQTKKKSEIEFNKYYDEYIKIFNSAEHSKGIR